MPLKSLELIGFKSFAQKTTLDFPGGIVAIVGPNGSGKSNIIDAVRWILGERESKNLRSAKSEDLIFAGTPDRVRSGMAEVRLTFDNSLGDFQSDFKEISISRRINRDGNSTFLINKSESKLRDIIDFFAKAKLGAKGLSIINQGSSDIFVSSNPIERRSMIEELLGLREFQLKKLDAERRLKNTSLNAEKISLTIDELKPHLKILRKQTTRWEKRSEIAAELKKLEDELYSYQFSIIDNALKVNDKKFFEIELKISKINKKLKNSQSEIEELEASQPEQFTILKELRTNLRHLFEKRSDLNKEFAEL